MTQRKPAIGFIGLGIMGKPMARNLMKAGYELVVLNRSRGPVDELAAEGAAAGTSPRDVASRSDVVITMLPDSPDVEAVALGPDGIAAGIKSGALWIDMSTIAPATTKSVAAELAAKGVTSVDAPVSGGEKGAIDAALSIMVGGSEEAFARAKPIFEALRQEHRPRRRARCRPSHQSLQSNRRRRDDRGSRRSARARRSLGRRSGESSRRAARRLRAEQDPRSPRSAHDRPHLQPGFKAKLHRKDMNIAANAGDEHHLDLGAAKLVRERFDALIARGDGEKDHSALRTLYPLRDTAPVG